MKCPKCAVNLSLYDRNGIEIDYCPECRGVWLDRGELDKIIERSNDLSRSKKSDYDYENSKSLLSDDAHIFEKRDKDTNRHYKKKSLLSDLFDF